MTTKRAVSTCFNLATSRIAQEAAAALDGSRVVVYAFRAKVNSILGWKTSGGRLAHESPALLSSFLPRLV